MADVREDAMRRGGELDVNLNISGGADKGITGNNSSSFGGKQQKTLTEQLKKMAGIDIGVGALLKQSQIFTGFLGNLFAIVGALIDTVLAPLAPMAFKALGHLGKIIPKVAETANKWIPKIADWVGGIITKIDRFFKRFDPSWAKKALYILSGVLAANLAIKTLMMTGRMGASVLGLRSGGALNLAGKGVGGLGRLGGSLATRGIGGTLAAGGSALMGTRLLGGGGGGGAAVGGTGASSTMGRFNPETGQFEPGGGKGMSAGGRNLANQTKPPSVPQGTIKGGMARLGRLGSMRGMGRVPVIGGLITGAQVYSESREQGMSQGKSAAKAGTVGAATMAGVWGGAKLGAMAGTPFGPAGMAIGGLAGGVIGGGLGYMTASGGFDALFGKKGKGGGGGSGQYNMDIGGSSGAAGYRAPLFVAEAAEFWSEQVRKDGAVLDDHTIEVELSKRKIAEEAAAREKAAKEFADYLAHVEKVGTHSGLDSMEKDSKDDPDDIGTGGAGLSPMFRDPEVVAKEKAAKEKEKAAKEAALQKAEEEAAAAANAAAIKRNNEWMAEQKRLNDKMMADDAAEADKIHKQMLLDAVEKRRLAEQRDANRDLLESDGTLGNPLSAANQIKLELTSKAFESTEIFVARNIGNNLYQATAWTDEDPWRTG